MQRVIVLSPDEYDESIFNDFDHYTRASFKIESVIKNLRSKEVDFLLEKRQSYSINKF